VEAPFLIYRGAGKRRGDAAMMEGTVVEGVEGEMGVLTRRSKSLMTSSMRF
jgi:hypothetical protein